MLTLGPLLSFTGTAALAAGTAGDPPSELALPPAPHLPDTPPAAEASAPKPRNQRVSRITLQPFFDGNKLPLVTAELMLTELRGIEARSLETALGERLAAALRAQSP